MINVINATPNKPIIVPILNSFPKKLNKASEPITLPKDNAKLKIPAAP